ncbi:MAG: phosphatidate cytidylyltransferase [Candidatus Fervidibacter sacchari]|jgi:CDP-diglyceride synthetase
MLGLRVLSALIGIPIALFLIFVGDLPFAFAVAALALIGLWELTQKFEGRGIRIVKEVAFPCVGTAVLGSHWVQPEHRLYLLVTIWWVGIFGSMVFHIVKSSNLGSESSGGRASSVASTVFAIAYLSLFALLVLLRDFEVSVSERPYPVGRDLILLTLTSVWVTDSVAFFLGRTFGKEPLAPQVSPGKTLEGSVAGTIGGFVTAWLFAWALISFGSKVTSQVWLNLARPVPFTLLALALGTLGQIGDLGKSVLKRSLGVKDFGSIIPGHGGVLDRFDSLLATTPIVYLYARWLLG